MNEENEHYVSLRYYSDDDLEGIDITDDELFNKTIERKKYIMFAVWNMMKMGTLLLLA